MVQKMSDMVFKQPPNLGIKEMVKCWEVLECQEKACPAYNSRNVRCWLISGTHCRSEIHGNFLDKIELCIGCKVFTMNYDVDSIKETLKIVDKQFKGSLGSNLH